ncbi:hypothetical protein J7T55_008340 [Diaporthe amygdali]|uniref:uncharacterized protein n=1 Tax=Phomopsis amygdali TaxID=1214568 RepID=UPI0022FE1CB5|nr:uncharacterized protein J7T55_008340 [Diaporthe amygdali]KAJ0121178.1 hypothetical protein J7T55_008340 [Diaporthe amygdali]
MAPKLSNIDHTEEEQDDYWVVVQEGMYSEKRRPQLKECNISPAQKPASIIGDDALSDLACKPSHTNCCPHALGVGLHGVNTSDKNPTINPKMESADSTATDLTFGAPEDVSSDPQPHTPDEDSPPQPLTQANLGPDNTPRLIHDIQAWINGDLGWLRIAVGCDQISILPFEKSTTCRSSDGSLDFVFIPAQSSSFGRDAQAIGTVFEHLPYVTTYSSQMELDEA